jgi:hypothetical protein
LLRVILSTDRISDNFAGPAKAPFNNANLNGRTAWR